MNPEMEIGTDKKALRIIVANRVGTDDGVSFCGASTIIDPYGGVIASACQNREAAGCL